MKEFFKSVTVGQWVAVGIIAALVIVGVVLHLVQPSVSYAFTEILATGTFVLGGVVGYLLKKKNVVQTVTTAAKVVKTTKAKAKKA